ncbi:unnamed protein product [Blepharisma stoltei]|uniref:Uncharacterized protein n=1 Tax=Blepharisma stoltei TaxID=1481888 RepID=A0AAU9JBW1_9CILI|nr:unnamed protein product [Blepharisma stoltei]
MFRIPLLRFKHNPKRGTQEYRDFQERLRIRKNPNAAEVQKPEIPVEEAPEIPVPDAIRIPLKFCVIPPVIFTLGACGADYFSYQFSKFLKIAGYWCCFYSTFMGSVWAGLEMLRYKPPFYAYPSYNVFVRSSRLFASFGQCMLGVYGIRSFDKESWSGIMIYTGLQSFTSLWCISSHYRGLIPTWVKNMQWPLMMICQATLLLLGVRVFLKESYISRMKKLASDINQGNYKKENKEN